MIRAVAIIRPAVPLRQVFCSLTGGTAAQSCRMFEEKLGGLFNSRHVRVLDSGLSAFLCVLAGLKAVSGRREVVLPAYTAGSLVVAVKQAGLVPVLCDVSLDDFNMDLSLLPQTLSQRTLAVVAVHLFGIPQQGISGLRQTLPADVVLIEDCCQAMCSTVAGRAVGSFAQVAFYSFNRGKNTALFGGGAVSVFDERFAGGILACCDAVAFASAAAEATALLRMVASPAATWPGYYGLLAPLLGGMRRNTPPAGVYPSRLTAVQARLGIAGLAGWDALGQQRRRIGALLLEGLRDVPGIRVPRMDADVQAAFNRFPLLCRDTAHALVLQAALWKAGIESSRMYLQSLPEMFDLGYAADAFPRARELAQRLLTLPVYPGLRDRDVHTMIEVMRTCCR